MTKIQRLILEINSLDNSELELILAEIHKRVDKEKWIKSILNEYRGMGKGIWEEDAQEYINKERDQDRA